jgi:Ran GTPase-activating protein (RanGAP) involved in mRNA processing and transport
LKNNRKVIHTTNVTRLYFTSSDETAGDLYLKILISHNFLEKLSSLGIQHSGMTDEGVKLLAEQLKTNRSLEAVGLRYNVIGIDGAIALEGALLVNHTVRWIHLEGNSDIMDSKSNPFPNISNWNVGRRFY